MTWWNIPLYRPTRPCVICKKPCTQEWVLVEKDVNYYACDLRCSTAYWIGKIVFPLIGRAPIK